MAGDALERICGEVNSKCGVLRAASSLLVDLSQRDADEMLLLMREEALRLASSLEEHRLMAGRRASRESGHRFSEHETGGI